MQPEIRDLDRGVSTVMRPRHAAGYSPAARAGVCALRKCPARAVAVTDLRSMYVRRVLLGVSTLSLAALLAGCAKPLAPIVEAPTRLPPHLGPPPSALCTVSPFHVTDGGSANVVMTIGNDGGYCAASLVAGNGAPYDAPLVPALPAHGSETVVKYNGRTSVEYAATPGFVGHDAFTVHLILKGQPGYTTLNVSVDVQPAGAAHTS